MFLFTFCPLNKLIVCQRLQSLLHRTLHTKLWFPEQMSVQNCLPKLLQHQPQCFIEALSVDKQRGCQYFPILELQSSRKAPSSTALPRTQLANLAGAAVYKLSTAPQIWPTFALLMGTMARTGRDATHPKKHSRIIDSKLRKAFHASVLSARQTLSSWFI